MRSCLIFLDLGDLYQHAKSALNTVAPTKEWKRYAKIVHGRPIREALMLENHISPPARLGAYTVCPDLKYNELT